MLSALSLMLQPFCVNCICFARFATWTIKKINIRSWSAFRRPTLWHSYSHSRVDWVVREEFMGLMDIHGFLARLPEMLCYDGNMEHCPGRWLPLEVEVYSGEG